MPPPSIDPTAIIEDGATLGEGVSVGAFCFVGGRVRLEDGVRLVSHVRVEGRTTIGTRTVIHAFSAIGGPPQDLKYAGGDTRLEIGADNVIREHVSMHRGTEKGGGLTRVGNHGLFMVGSHVAHDCRIGDHVIMVNNALLGGHVTLEDHVIISGNSGVLQFMRVGRHAIIGGMTGVSKDVIPYGFALGVPGFLRGLNLVGLQRHGYERRQIRDLRAAYDMLFLGEGRFIDRLKRVEGTFGDVECVRHILDFINVDNARHYMTPRE